MPQEISRQDYCSTQKKPPQGAPPQGAPPCRTQNNPQTHSQTRSVDVRSDRHGTKTLTQNKPTQGNPHQSHPYPRAVFQMRSCRRKGSRTWRIQEVPAQQDQESQDHISEAGSKGVRICIEEMQSTSQQGCAGKTPWTQTIYGSSPRRTGSRNTIQPMEPPF